MTTVPRHQHVWRFFRAGGFDQVRLDRGSDLAALEQLDPKLWVALSCPTRGLEFDDKTLELIDTDRDGRIRVPEVVAATKWACACLKDPEQLLEGGASLPLQAIQDATPEGRQLLSSARQILANLGKPDAQSISLEDTADSTRIFHATYFNGDGVVPPEAAEDPAISSAITDIIACLGADTDRSGKPGVSQAKVDQFFAEATAYLEWCQEARQDPAILPLGEGTGAAAAAVNAIHKKVDDYFVRSRLAAFDPNGASGLNPADKDYLALAGKNLSAATPELAALPLVTIRADQGLPLRGAVNPAWAGAIEALRRDAVQPLLGEGESLTAAQWEALCAKLAPYQSWMARQRGAPVAKLGAARVHELLTGPSRPAIAALLAQDKALEPEANSIAAVDRLVHYHRDLFRLLNNFVSFHDFYSRRDKAIFQAGTLYLDQRSCDLCLRVGDAGKHAALAGLAGTCLVYCDCVRPSTGEKMQILAGFTDGDSDNLMVGRNGIFFDRTGMDWDATITKIIDNPISIREAFWAPYKKLVRLVEEQIAKRAGAMDTATTAELQAMATAAVQPDKSGGASLPRRLDVGVVAALGVALGAIGTALSALATGLLKLPAWQMPLAFAGLALLISGPSMLIAWLKLRKRNLGPILDANGWAVNAKAKINVPFGHSLTSVAALPPGAQRDLIDPFAERKSPWPALAILAVILWVTYTLLSSMGFIHEWTNGRLGEPRQRPPSTAPTHEPKPLEAPK